jgi:hypothetical protein
MNTRTHEHPNTDVNTQTLAHLMKNVQASIDVDTHGRRPRRIYWDGRTYRVRRVLDYWILQGRWWADEERRLYLRLDTRRAVLEVYRRGGDWTLSRIVD